MVQMSKREQMGAVILAGLLLAGLILRFAFMPKPAEVEVKPPKVPAETEAETEKEQTNIIVHVAGAVHQPGVYTLKEGARVINAIEAAGGVLDEADEHAINLAEPLYDGRRITVPYRGDGTVSGSESNGKININTANAAELDHLPGIGPTKAAAIVAYREQNGPFKAIEDLANVSGIGPNTVETLREHITLY